MYVHVESFDVRLQVVQQRSDFIAMIHSPDHVLELLDILLFF